jgi:hypothetical protein
MAEDFYFQQGKRVIYLGWRLALARKYFGRSGNNLVKVKILNKLLKPLKNLLEKLNFGIHVNLENISRTCLYLNSFY